MAFAKFKKRVKVTPNCLACGVGLVTRIMSTFGLCSQIKCCHTNAKTYEIVTGKFHILNGSVISSILLSSCIYHIFEIVNAERDILRICLLMENMIYCFRSALIIISAILLMEINKYTYKGPEVVIRHWKAYTAIDIFKRKDIERLRKRSTTIIITLLFLLVTHVVYSISIDINLEFWKIVNKIAEFLCFTIDFMLVLGNLTTTTLSKTMFLNYQSYLKKQMSKKLNFVAQRQSKRFLIQQKFSLYTFLIMSRRLHSAFILYYEYWNKFCGFISVVMIVSYGIISIINGFIVAITISAYTHEEPFPVPVEFYGLMFQLCISALLSMYAIYDIQHIECVVS